MRFIAIADLLLITPASISCMRGLCMSVHALKGKR